MQMNDRSLPVHYDLFKRDKSECENSSETLGIHQRILPAFIIKENKG
jgi:hypothetical protein